MRKCCVLLVVLLLIAIPATAQNQYWAFDDEAFYHAVENCGGQQGRRSVGADILSPCPVCVGVAKEYADGMQAVERGGTVVLRVTDEFMAQAGYEPQDIFAAPAWQQFDGMQAYAALSEYMSGDALQEMALALSGSDPVQRTALVPDIYGRYSEKLKRNRVRTLSKRHIDGCWYQCVHPTFDGNLTSDDLQWRIQNVQLSAQNGVLTGEWAQEVTDLPQIRPTTDSAEEQLYYSERNGLSVRVMREMDAYICVVREYWADADLLEDVQLCIDGCYAPITVSGYMDGEDGVYVVVLSEGEYRLVADGAAVTLQRQPWYANAEYCDSPYAVAQKGSGAVCIVDRGGNIVLAAQDGGSIVRGECHVGSSVSIAPPYIVRAANGDTALLDGETLETIAEYRAADGYSGLEMVHLGAYRIRNGNTGGVEYYSLPDAAPLFVNEQPDVDYSGLYFYAQQGRPQRMVAANGNHHCWLTDNVGNKIEGSEYNAITPLLWRENSGVYLVATYDVPEDDWSDNNPVYTSVYGYGDALYAEDADSTWRCGLIDENGELLAEVKYTSFTMVSDTEAILSNDDEVLIVNF